MDSRYSYDENGETWPIFALAVISVGVVPTTLHSIYNVISNKSSNETTVAGSIPIDDTNSPSEVIKFRSNSKKSKLFSKKTLFLLFGWLSIFLLFNHISTTEVTPSTNAFDPFEILGIDYGSTEKEIKSHFRKLSIKFHPDKISKDVTDEEKIQLEEKFVLISKAYQALTDTEIKENYEKYGHPDGPQQASHGIALPKFLIEGKSSPFLLVAYILLIGIILPTIVSNWWTRSKSHTKRGISNETASLFVEKLLNHKPSQVVKDSVILDWLTDSYELQQFNKSKSELLTILDNYLERKLLSQSDLKIVSKIPTLINGLIDLAAGFRNTEISITAVDTLKHFIQAVKESPKNELLQLPNVDSKSIENTNVVRLGKLLTLSDDLIKQTLGITDEIKLKETLEVATKIPILKLVKAEWVVPGETVVTPSSNAYISIKFIVKSAKHHFETLPKIDESKLQEDQSLESLRDPFKIVTEQLKLPKTYAPYFPLEKNSNYIAFVILQKDSKISEAPVFFENLDLSNLNLTQEEFLKGDDLKIGTFKIPIAQPTPPEPGKYQFRVVIKSLDYFTQDIDTTVIMNVQHPPKLEEINYDIPDPDEDSIAGALASMKGEKVKKVDDDSDDDEDDSDFEVESDFTDINTDTEDETE